METKKKHSRSLKRALAEAFSRLRESHHDDFPLTVYYAFKQAESDDDDYRDEDPLSTSQQLRPDGRRCLRVWFVLDSASQALGLFGPNVELEMSESGTMRLPPPSSSSAALAPTTPRWQHARSSSRLYVGIARGTAESATGKHRAGGLGAGGDWPGHGRLHPLCQGHGERRFADDRPHRPGTHQPGA